jgi:hypothetical protein
MSWRVKALLCLALALGLTGCAAVQDQQAVPVVPPAPAPASAQSQQLQAYYAQVQQQLLAQGLLRTDGGGADAAFDDRILAATFLKIALYNEYTESGGQSVQLQSEASLRRWQGPLRVALRFGASVPAARQASDRAQIASFLQRLAGLTGLQITLNAANPNFFIYVVNEDERRALAPALHQTMPELGPNDQRTILDLPKTTYCLAVTQSAADDSIYTRAIVVIRAEHPDLLRLSCVHEELAQAMGLPNDSPEARPSIFNDDEEFALLTAQDALMLRLLYNPALRPGMRLDQARPIVTVLAKQLMRDAP